MLQSRALMSCMKASLLGAMFVMAAQSFACGLEPTVKGGFSVSHPGALDVAVAVAKARSAGTLPLADGNADSNSVLLRKMIADLTRLQSRLSTNPDDASDDSSTASFSLVLVGPGLWSHYHATPGGVVGEYHTDGPVAGQVVVLTHYAVLRMLLRGDLSVEQATDLGLIAFAGSDTGPVRKAFENGFRSRT